MGSTRPEERALIGRIAAHTKWANTADRSAATAPARKASLDRFERQVDPDGVLPPGERAIRAGHARKAFFQRMALLSVQARRARAHAAELEAEVAEGLADEAAS